MATPERPSIVFEIDGTNTIVSAHTTMGEYSSVHSSTRMLVLSLVGHNLSELASGAESWKLIQMVLSEIRKSGTGTKLPFRFDFRDRFLFLDLLLMPRSDHHIEVRGEILREERRIRQGENLTIPLPTNPSLTICQDCGLALTSTSWVRVEEAISAMGVFLGTETPRVFSSICESCQRRAELTHKANLDAEAREGNKGGQEPGPQCESKKAVGSTTDH